MPPSRDDDDTFRLERENRRLAQALADSERDRHRLRCEVRRMAEELDWRDEQIRVYRRAVERLV